MGNKTNQFVFYGASINFHKDQILHGPKTDIMVLKMYADETSLFYLENVDISDIRMCSRVTKPAPG